VYDAWFLLNSARRMQERRRLGKPPVEVVKPERQYLEQRERARAKRRAAAEAVDNAVTPRSVKVNNRPVLMWRAHPDDKTTWECVAADGHWFYADKPPFIGYPGMPHGGTCRCWPAQATPMSLALGTVDEAVRSAQGVADHPAERFPRPVPMPATGEAEAS
jgi:hypothetical protein